MRISQLKIVPKKPIVKDEDISFDALKEELSRIASAIRLPTTVHTRNLPMFVISVDDKSAKISLRASEVKNHKDIDIGKLFTLVSKGKKWAFEIDEIRRDANRYILTITNPRPL